MSGLEIILPALALAGTATSTVLGMGAAAQEQQARENQQRAAEAQAKSDYERKIAEASARGNMADRAAKAKMADAEANAIGATGEGLNAASRGVLAALFNDERDTHAAQAAQMDADKKFMLKTGQIARRDARSAFKTAQLGRAAGGLASLIGGARDMNLGGSKPLPSTDPRSWNTTTTIYK
jgi:hypothetical protein